MTTYNATFVTEPIKCHKCFEALKKTFGRRTEDFSTIYSQGSLNVLAGRYVSSSLIGVERLDIEECMFFSKEELCHPLRLVILPEKSGPILLEFRAGATPMVDTNRYE